MYTVLYSLFCILVENKHCAIIKSTKHYNYTYYMYIQIKHGAATCRVLLPSVLLSEAAQLMRHNLRNGSLLQTIQDDSKELKVIIN